MTDGNMDFGREVAALVERVVADSTGRSVQLSPDHELIGGGLLDSLSMVNLILALHEAYGVEVDVLEIDEENFGSPAAIARFVQKRRG